MLDSMFISNPLTGFDANARFGQGVAVVNPPRPAPIAPTGNVRGLAVNSITADRGQDLAATIDGRMSLAALGALVIGLVGFYAWTRNVQAGG